MDWDTGHHSSSGTGHRMCVFYLPVYIYPLFLHLGLCSGMLAHVDCIKRASLSLASGCFSQWQASQGWGRMRSPSKRTHGLDFPGNEAGRAAASDSIFSIPMRQRQPAPEPQLCIHSRPLQRPLPGSSGVPPICSSHCTPGLVPKQKRANMVPLGLQPSDPAHCSEEDHEEGAAPASPLLSTLLTALPAVPRTNARCSPLPIAFHARDLFPP